MGFAVEIDVSKIDQAISNLKNARKNMQNTLLQTGESVKGWIVENIGSAGTSGRFVIEPWMPMSPWTARMKSLAGKSGALMAGFLNGWLVEQTEDGVTIGNTKPYVIYHQQGANQTATKKQSVYLWARYGIGFKTGAPIKLPQRMLIGELTEASLDDLGKLVIEKILIIKN